MHAPTEENVAVVDDLVLSQEDEPQIHHSPRPAAQSAVIHIVFSPQTPAEDLTKAIHYENSAAQNSC